MKILRLCDSFKFIIYSYLHFVLSIIGEMAELVMGTSENILSLACKKLTHRNSARLRYSLAQFPGHESGVGSSPTLINKHPFFAFFSKPLSGCGIGSEWRGRI
jgi:hypothetical protein